jgi:xanthine dehydrogenase accessory factor
VYWEGQTEPDSKLPDGDTRRVLRSPANGNVSSLKEIGDLCKEGEKVCTVDGKAVTSPFDGILRGMIHPQVDVIEGMKIGDIDSRNDPKLCTTVSDKALAVSGGALEAVLMKMRELEIEE